MRRLLALRDARIYLAGQLLSAFGDSVMWLATAIWVKTLTGSDGAAGLVFFAFTLPQLFAPGAGLLVDRFSRRRVLLFTNLAAAAVVLSLAAVRGAGQVWLIYAAMVGYGAAYTILSAGQVALLKDLVPEDLLANANSLLRTVQEGFRLVGPLLGAGLFALFGGATVAVVDAVTFLGAALALTLLRIDDHAPAPRAGHWRTEIAAGFRFIAATPRLRHVVAACAASFLVVGFTESAVFAVVAGLHRPATFVAVLTVAQGGAAVVSGPLAPRAIGRVGEAGLTAAGLALCAAGIALLTVGSIPVVLAGAALLGAALPWIVIGPVTLIQRVSPRRLVGRVSAAADLLTGTPQTVSIAVGAALITVFDYRLLLLIAAAVMGASAVYLALQRSAGTTDLGSGVPTSSSRPAPSRSRRRCRCDA